MLSEPTAPVCSIVFWCALLCLIVFCCALLCSSMLYCVLLCSCMLYSIFAPVCSSVRFCVLVCYTVLLCVLVCSCVFLYARVSYLDGPPGPPIRWVRKRRRNPFSFVLFKCLFMYVYKHILLVWYQHFVIFIIVVC